MEIKTYADVVGEMARVGVRHKDVAAQMGMTASALSSILKDREGRPSHERIAQFRDAINACAKGIPTR